MRKSLSTNLRFIFLLGDLAILNLTAAATWLLYTHVNFQLQDLLVLLASLNGAWLMLSLFFNPYKFSRVSGFAKILRAHISFIIIHFLTVAGSLFLLNIGGLSSPHMLVTFGAYVILLFFWRVFYFYLNKIIINKKLNFKNVVIVGFGDLAWEMRKFFRLHPEFGYRFLGYFDQNIKNREVNSLDGLDTFCKQNDVHEIYCCLSYIDNRKVKFLVF